MNLWNRKTERTVGKDGIVYQWYQSYNIVFHKKWQWGLVEDWYDGPINWLHCGFFSFVSAEDYEKVNDARS